MVTALHAHGAALPYMLEGAIEAWEQTQAFAMINPTIGLDADLVSTCGPIEIGEWSESREACLRTWFLADESPSRLGQIIAYDLLYFRIRDGWNLLGTDGGCVGGLKYCPKYKDVTGYDPNQKSCGKEPIS